MSMLLAQLKRLVLDNAVGLYVFETTVGVKYRFGRFHSDMFDRFVEEEFSLEANGLLVNNLELPPDLLRNRYTSCGNSISESTHYELMSDLAQNKLTMDSTYISRRNAGTLDAWEHHECDIESIRRDFKARIKALDEGELFTIHAFKVFYRNKNHFVIVDGKHRAALVAYLKRPQALRVRLISLSFARERFFQRVYTHILKLSPSEYSKNQEMIRAIYNSEY